MIADRHIERFQGIKKYLCGRIGANPFFGVEAKHALIGFLDYVIIPSASGLRNIGQQTMLRSFRTILPFDLKKMVRKRGINLSKTLISNNSKTSQNVWEAIKAQVLSIMTRLDALPDLNRIPIERALNRIPSKVFAIQIHAALISSKEFDKQHGLQNMHNLNVPVLIIKSKKDGIAKFVSHNYDSDSVSIMDVTNYNEKDLFREHLFHMVNPLETAKIIDTFIDESEVSRKKLAKELVNN